MEPNYYIVRLHPTWAEIRWLEEGPPPSWPDAVYAAQYAYACGYHD